MIGRKVVCFLTASYLGSLLASQVSASSGNSGQVPRGCFETLMASESKFQDVANMMLSNERFDGDVLDQVDEEISAYLASVKVCEAVISDVVVVDGKHIFPKFATESIVAQFQKVGFYVTAFEDGASGSQELRDHMTTAFRHFLKNGALRVKNSADELRPLAELVDEVGDSANQ